MSHSYDPDSQSGVIVESGEKAYTVRLRIPAGIVTPQQLQHIADAAERYGGDGIHLTTRQTIEIPHVPEENLQAGNDESVHIEAFKNSPSQGWLVEIQGCMRMVQCGHSSRK